MVRRTVLCDLDGTLWNSRPWYAEVLASLCDRSVAQLSSRLSTGANIVRLMKDSHVSQNRFVQQAVADASTLELYAGVVDTLEELRRRTVAMGVVTNLPGWLARPLMEAVDIHQYFQATVTPRWGVPAKPQPHGIRKALREMGAMDGSETYYVGDADEDAEAAEGRTYGSRGLPTDTERTRRTNTAVVLHEIRSLLDL